MTDIKLPPLPPSISLRRISRKDGGYEMVPHTSPPLPDVGRELVRCLQVAVTQNEHDMMMTGEELRSCRAALAKAGSAK